jgi:hypothetical protein
MVLPTLISVSDAPGSYFLCAQAGDSPTAMPNRTDVAVNQTLKNMITSERADTRPRPSSKIGRAKG